MDSKKLSNAGQVAICNIGLKWRAQMYRGAAPTLSMLIVSIVAGCIGALGTAYILNRPGFVDAFANSDVIGAMIGAIIAIGGARWIDHRKNKEAFESHRSFLLRIAQTIADESSALLAFCETGPSNGMTGQGATDVVDPKIHKLRAMLEDARDLLSRTVIVDPETLRLLRAMIANVEVKLNHIPLVFVNFRVFPSEMFDHRPAESLKEHVMAIHVAATDAVNVIRNARF